MPSMTAKTDMPPSPARLSVKVVPGASKTEVSGWLGDMLKIRVASQPEKGKANMAVIALLAKNLDVSKKSIHVVSGKTSQQKIIEFQGLTLAQVKQKLCGNL